VPEKIGFGCYFFPFFFFQAHSSLSPLFAASFVNLTELDLCWNKLLVSLPVWLQHGLTNLRKLRLGGCESLDFGALSTFLNGSTVNDLDLSNNYLFLTSPAEISVFIGKAKTIKRLRSEHSPCLQKSPDSKNLFINQ